MTTEQLHQKYGDVEVACVRAEDIISNRPAGSFFFSPHHVVRPEAETVARPRYLAETDPSYKQQVLYTLLRQQDTHKVYVTTRIAGDHRLVGMCSLGTGGHADPNEEPFETMLRELHEEVGIEDADIVAAASIGYIYDDSSEVNSVHIGVVNEAIVPVHADVAVRETEKLTGQWMTVQEVKALRDAGRLESWSEILFDAVLRKECV